MRKKVKSAFIMFVILLFAVILPIMAVEFTEINETNETNEMNETNETKETNEMIASSLSNGDGNGDIDTDNLQQSIASKILRFHVLANSDSETDQTLKLSVRDAVGTYLEPILSDVSNLEETKQIVSENLDEVVDISEQIVEEAGYSYTVTAELAKVDFPEKTYGDYTFPAGTYEALEIVIGDGEGQNWWCVLYPNMCFRGSVYEVVDEGADEALREVLSPEEYEEVFSSDQLEVRFWLLEWLKNLFR